MPRSRHSIVVALALWAGGLLLFATAQDLPTSGSSSSSSSTGTSSSSTDTSTPSAPGASSSFGTTPDTTTTTTPTTTPTTPTTPAAPPASTFGTTPPTPGGGTTQGTTPPGFIPPFSTPSTPSSSFEGTGASTRASAEPPPTFTLPGLYGRGSSTFVAGTGRLARPVFRYTGSVTFGLDDNVFSTPFNAKPTPAVTQEEVVVPAQPARTVLFVFQPNGARQAFFGQRPVVIPFTIPAQPARTRQVVVVPEIPVPARTVSFIGRVNLGYEVQFVSRRTLFTMDLNGSASYYTNRPGDPVDLNGSLSFSFLHKITPRLQFTASASLSYLSQPNPQLVNSPTNANTGDFFNGSFKTDLTYRWTKRFSTVTSFTENATLFAQTSQLANNFYESILGTEARYLLFPRLTTIGEVRYGMTTHDSAPDLDSHSIYFLLGAEFPITKHLGASVRIGTQTRTFDVSGNSQTGPYGETALTWHYHPAGTLTWLTHFGYEEPPTAFDTLQVLRTSVNVVQAFSARLKATGGISAAFSADQNSVTNKTLSSNVLTIDAGMEYVLTPNITLTGNYTFTGFLSSQPGTDYIRNQIFFGFRYSF